MEEQHFDIQDLILFVAYLGSVTFLIGFIFQAFVAFKTQKFISSNAIFLLIITRLASFAATFLIWINWPFSFDVMFGPIFIPAFIAELVLNPLLLFLAGFKVNFKKKIAFKINA